MERDAMSRWRPPGPKSSPYITAPGFAKMNDELRALWETRADVTAALAAAAAEGDRSENAEYIYRKKQLREIDRRIRYLQKRLPNLKVVRNVADTQHVYFGARVTVEKDDGSEVAYRIVGPDETDAKRGCISVDSPVARALLKKKIDDEVVVDIGNDKVTFYIVDINYEEQQQDQRC